MDPGPTLVLSHVKKLTYLGYTRLQVQKVKRLPMLKCFLVKKVEQSYKSGYD
jgi:hypothetical protein